MSNACKIDDCTCDVADVVARAVRDAACRAKQSGYRASRSSRETLFIKMRGRRKISVKLKTVKVMPHATYRFSRDVP